MSGKKYAQRKQKKRNRRINTNLEIGENSQMMFHLPRDQAEPCNLNFEAQMHQLLSNKQPGLEVTFPMMLGAISISIYHQKSKLSITPSNLTS